MPIPVVCGNCQTRLNAPDAAAGRKVKCPKCQTIMAVPGAADDLPPPPPPPPPAGGGSPFDFGGESPPPPPARRPSGESQSSRPAPEPEPPAPPAGGAAFDFGAAVDAGTGAKGRGDREDRPRRRGGDDLPPDREDRPRRPRPRDDDAGDDRPRGRRPEGGGKKFPLMLVLLGLGAVLMLCCVAPVGGYFVFIAPKIKEAAERIKAENDALEKRIADEKKRQTGGGDSGSLPPGWTKFEAPDKSVRAAFPTPFPDDGGLSLQTPTVTGAKSWKSEDADGSLTCILAVVKFRPTSKASDRDRDLKLAAGMMNFAAKDLSTPASIGWLGAQAKEMPGKSALSPDTNVVTRWVVVGNTGYVAMVLHKNKPDAAATFFTNVEALSK